MVANSYPNEILPSRLWVGNWHHAADATIIETLGITHILNISDTCENYLEKTHRKLYFFILFFTAYLKYLHLCLHDTKEQKIDAAFKMIFDFIEAAIIPEEFSPTRSGGRYKLKSHDESDFPVSN